MCIGIPYYVSFVLITGVPCPSITAVIAHVVECSLHVREAGVRSSVASYQRR